MRLIHYRTTRALIAILALCFSLSRAEDQVQENQEPLSLFLLVGQSNMAGRGKLGDEDRIENPKVLTLTKDLKWKPAVEPIHFDKPGVVGVGLGKTFGETLVTSNPDIKVGLIPCAVGGSPIDAWKAGAFYKPTNSHPWDDAISRAKYAMQFGEIQGILWHQGESDSSEGLAEVYECKLHELIARFRSELGNDEIPFIVGQMGRFPERPWNESKSRVDQAHQNLPHKVKNTGFVSAEGLNHKGDNIHFDSASYRELGRRYAEAILKMRDWRMIHSQ